MSLRDKILEQERYNASSSAKKDTDGIIFLRTLGADNFEPFVQPPYLLYNKLIADLAKAKCNFNHLDLCCGDGIHSLTSAFLGANVIAIDYAENSIKLAKKRAELFNLNIDFRVGDVEKLPFANETFELITCAGSLSYLDHNIFLEEVFRVLKPGGTFICVDSLNHNVFYRVNRFLHYLKGQRTYSTLKRMPNLNLINKIKNQYKDFEVYYFGIFNFLSPILKKLMNPIQLKRKMQNLDNKFKFLRKYSFKIVFKATK